MASDAKLLVSTVSAALAVVASAFIAVSSLSSASLSELAVSIKFALPLAAYCPSVAKPAPA